MKHLFLSTLAALATVAVSAPLGLAQSTLTATVPFAFAIDAHHVLPAGSYVVIRSGDQWRFRSQETKSVVFVTGHPEESRRADPSQLVFECRANRCALRQIQAGRGELGYYLPPARARGAEALELAQVVSIPLTRSEGN
jgi:hypothetical protein